MRRSQNDVSRMFQPPHRQGHRGERSSNPCGVGACEGSVVLHLEVLPFYQLPSYSRVLPGLLIRVMGMSSTSYSPSIWAPDTRVPGYSSDYVHNPGHGNLSSSKSRPLGTISYDILQEILLKMKMWYHASRVTVAYTSSSSYSPSIWAPDIRVPG